MTFALHGFCERKRNCCTELHLGKWKGLRSLKHVVVPRFNSWINVYERDIVGRGPVLGFGLDRVSRDSLTKITI